MFVSSLDVGASLDTDVAFAVLRCAGKTLGPSFDDHLTRTVRSPADLLLDPFVQLDLLDHVEVGLPTTEARDAIPPIRRAVLVHIRASEIVASIVGAHTGAHAPEDAERGTGGEEDDVTVGSIVGFVGNGKDDADGRHRWYASVVASPSRSNGCGRDLEDLANALEAVGTCAFVSSGERGCSSRVGASSAQRARAGPCREPPFEEIVTNPPPGTTVQSFRSWQDALGVTAAGGVPPGQQSTSLATMASGEIVRHGHSNVFEGYRDWTGTRHRKTDKCRRCLQLGLPCVTVEGPTERPCLACAAEANSCDATMTVDGDGNAAATVRPHSPPGILWDGRRYRDGWRNANHSRFAGRAGSPRPCMTLPMGSPDSDSDGEGLPPSPPTGAGRPTESGKKDQELMRRPWPAGGSWHDGVNGIVDRVWTQAPPVMPSSYRLPAVGDDATEGMSPLRSGSSGRVTPVAGSRACPIDVDAFAAEDDETSDEGVIDLDDVVTSDEGEGIIVLDDMGVESDEEEVDDDGALPRRSLSGAMHRGAR